MWNRIPGGEKRDARAVSGQGEDEMSGMAGAFRIPQFPSILRSPEAGEEPPSLRVSFDKNGLITRVDFLGGVIEGDSIHQLSGYSEESLRVKGLPPDCHYGLCYLNGEDLVRLLGGGELPASLREKNTVAQKNADGSETTGKVNGLYVSIFEKEGQVVLVVQSLGVFLLRDDGSVHGHTSFDQCARRKDLQLHRHPDPASAFAKGYAESAPIVLSFPIPWLSEQSSGSALPTGGRSVSLFIRWFLSTMYNEARKAQQSAGKNPPPIPPSEGKENGGRLR